MNYELQPHLYKSVSQSYFKSQDEGVLPKHRQMLSQEEIQEMFQAQNRMISFIEGIGEIKDTVIRTDVIEHCDRTKLNLNEYFSIENIEKMVKNRIEKMIKNKRIKKNWSEEDVKILTWIVSKYSDFKGISYIQRDLNIEDWKYIASLIPGVEAQSCMFKWLSLKKNNLTQHGWGDRQSQLLEKVVKKYGEKDWSLISQKLYFMNTNPHKIFRCAKQCRQHWNCYLNPNLKKGPWTKEEDLLLLTIIKKNKCQKRWAQMVSQFKGRTQNALKNRFTLIMEKQSKLHPKSQKLTQLQIIEQFLEKSYVQQFVDDTKKDQKVNQERMRTRRREAMQQAQNIYSSANIKIQQGDKGFVKNLELQKMISQQVVEEEQLPSVENISIVTLSSEQLKELTEIILSQKSDYVPCTFDNNKLKKISKM